MPNYIEPEEITDGMILAEPILNKNGAALLPAGAKLKKSHIKLLKVWNIKSISIESDKLEEEIEFTNEQIEKAKKSLRARMLWFPRNPIENDLFRLGALIKLKSSKERK